MGRVIAVAVFSFALFSAKSTLAQSPTDSPAGASAVLAGNWIKDYKTECKLWDQHPPQEGRSVRWSGACSAQGFAAGQGTAEWFQDEQSTGKLVVGYFCVDALDCVS